MRIHQVGIVGHRPERFRNSELAKSICRDTVLTIRHQYDDVNLYFNIGGCIGADQWVGDACVDYGVKFNMHLPSDVNTLAQHWYDYQKEALIKQTENCESLLTVGDEASKANFTDCSETIVRNSDFIICFWEGCLHGGTFETIKMALENSKLVLNGLNGLSLVSKEQLVSRKKWGI